MFPFRNQRSALLPSSGYQQRSSPLDTLQSAHPVSRVDRHKMAPLHPEFTAVVGHKTVLSLR